MTIKNSKTPIELLHIQSRLLELKQRTEDSTFYAAQEDNFIGLTPRDKSNYHAAFKHMSRSSDGKTKGIGEKLLTMTQEISKKQSSHCHTFFIKGSHNYSKSKAEPADFSPK